MEGRRAAVSITDRIDLELDDIQSGVLHERPSPYVGTYLLLRIDDRSAGRELVRRLLPLVDVGRPAADPVHGAWITVTFTYQGLAALGVPQDSLDSFAPEFRQGMAARAAHLGDVGDSDPANWEHPLGSGDVHVAIAAISVTPGGSELWWNGRDRRRGACRRRVHLAAGLLPTPDGAHVVRLPGRHRATGGRGKRTTLLELEGGADQGRGDHSRLSGRDGRAAADAGSGGPRPQRHVRRLPETSHQGGGLSAIPAREGRQPSRRGTSGRQDGRPLAERRSARPISGPGRSGLGADPHRRNDFGYADDPRGFRCPAGAHARRANPRDALDHEGSVNVRLHRMIRRGTSYGPVLPDGVLDDDGADRGIVFVFVGASLKRQFEFVKTQWLNDGIFIGAPAEKDPLVGPERQLRGFHHPHAADPPAPPESASVRRHPRRRVLLRPQPASDALAGAARHLTGRREEDDVTTNATSTDRWKDLDFGPPAADVEEPDSPVLLDYLSGGRIAVITLNRPHVDNAITTEMGARLTEIVEEIAVRPAVRVAILTGAGPRAFSVGSDLRQRKTMTKEGWLRQRQDFDRTLYTVRQLRKPIFAAVNGIAYGGGSNSRRARTSSSHRTTPASRNLRR